MSRLPGAAEYIAGTKLVTCKRCGAGHLAWAKSKRTGKSYLVNTSKSRSENALDLYVIEPWSPHSCDEYRARVEADRAATDKAAAERHANLMANQRIIIDIVRQARLAGRPAADVARALDMAGTLRRMNFPR